MPAADIWNMHSSKRKDILPLGNSSQKSAAIVSFHSVLCNSDTCIVLRAFSTPLEITEENDSD